MNEIEFLKDLILHKQIILQVGGKVVDHLHSLGEDKLAKDFSKRLIIHDNSKIRKEEIDTFTDIEDNENMENPNALIPDSLKESIRIHWRNNRHHPEHFDDYHDMLDIDVLEMVCDWYARSIQYGTDFRQFYKTRQKVRFCFDKEFFEKVKQYCDLVEELNKE